MDYAIKKQFIDSVSYTHLKELKNNYNGFLGIMCHNILEHLINQYKKSRLRTL